MAFTLPPLPYAFDAPEPHRDSHDGNSPRQAPPGLCNNLNAAIENTEWASKTIEEILANVSKLSPAVRNNGAVIIITILFGHWWGLVEGCLPVK